MSLLTDADAGRCRSGFLKHGRYLQAPAIHSIQYKMKHDSILLQPLYSPANMDLFLECFPILYPWELSHDHAMNNRLWLLELTASQVGDGTCLSFVHYTMRPPKGDIHSIIHLYPKWIQSEIKPQTEWSKQTSPSNWVNSWRLNAGDTKVMSGPKPPSKCPLSPCPKWNENEWMSPTMIVPSQYHLVFR